MKKLHGTATEVVAAPLDECPALLKAVDRYPTWYPEVVREVEVLDRDPSGQPTRARTKLHVSRGPLVKDFDLILAIVTEPPATVQLTRPTNDPSQQQFGVTWRLQDGDGTHIELYLDANLRVPPSMPEARRDLGVWATIHMGDSYEVGTAGASPDDSHTAIQSPDEWSSELFTRGERPAIAVSGTWPPTHPAGDE